MINEKYYNDIKNFPKQFALGFQNIETVTVSGSFDRVVVCGMGGSSLYVEMLNNYFATFTPFRLDVARGYDIPNFANEKTLLIIASHSGNTEETISCFEQAIAKKLSAVVFTSGGKLAEMAAANNVPVFNLPGGVQPRLTTGHFISGVLGLLMKLNIINDVKEQVLDAAVSLDQNLDENLAKELGKELKGKVPVIYLTDNVSGIARVCKIKFNENSKTQAFWNEIPEANHNEMIGFTNLVMNPYFLLFKSKFTNPRNIIRFQVLEKLMVEKGAPVKVLELKGANVFAEMLSAYYLVDHVTYYLSEENGIDPEPVPMVEEFKKLINMTS